MPILAIEDDDAFAELLRFWLSPREIRVARSLKEADAMIAETTPTVLLLDLALPDSTPDQTVARIEDLKKSANDATVIVVTGYGASRPTPRGAAKLLHKDAPGFFEELDRSLVDALEPSPHASATARKVAEEVRGLIDRGDHHP